MTEVMGNLFFENENHTATAKANIWCVLGNATVTLKQPYVLDYCYENGA